MRYQINQRLSKATTTRAIQNLITCMCSQRMCGAQQEEREHSSGAKQRRVPQRRVVLPGAGGRRVVRAAVRGAVPARLGVPTTARTLPTPSAPLAAVPQLLLDYSYLLHTLLIFMTSLLVHIIVTLRYDSYRSISYKLLCLSYK